MSGPPGRRGNANPNNNNNTTSNTTHTNSSSSSNRGSNRGNTTATNNNRNSNNNPTTTTTGTATSATSSTGSSYNPPSRRGGPARRKSRTGQQQQQPQQFHEERRGLTSDEDILVAFMPFLKGNNLEAAGIYNDYQTGKNDQRAFLMAARSFLREHPATESSSSHTMEAAAAASSSSSSSNNNHNHTHIPLPDCLPAAISSSTTGSTYHPDALPLRPDPPPGSIQHHQNPSATATTSTTPNRVLHSTTTPDRTTTHISASDSTTGTTTGSRLAAASVVASPLLAQSFGAMFSSETDSAATIPLPGANISSIGSNSVSSIWGSASPSSITPPPRPPGSFVNDTGGETIASSWTSNNKNGVLEYETHQTSLLLQAVLSGNASPLRPPTSSLPPATPVSSIKKEPFQPKRVWTHFQEQIGRIFVNGVSGEDPSVIIALGPRVELTADWSIPIDYLMKQPRPNFDPSDTSLDRALKGLVIGLFRRGCTENGPQASIVSKDVSGYNYWHDPGSSCIRGKVPFFSPRTPGNVLFRMYWESNTVQTLAMGPTLRVRVLEQDFESSVRFILSNFKGRKSNPTSLSSLHSLATVLETPLSRRHESTVSRSVWGCVQEARKVVEACYQEYIKTSSKMAQLDEKLEELKKQMEGDEIRSQEVSVNNGDPITKKSDEVEKAEAENALHEKTRALLGGRASCERKWRDCQLAFASILKAILKNVSMGSLLRRDLISRMRIEYELWCPLAEEFAVPLEKVETWYQCVDELPQSITADHFNIYQQARMKMQMRTLGFDLNTLSLEDILFPRSSNNPNQRTMDPGAVGVFNSMSGAMGKYYQDLFVDEDQVVRKRELIRQRIERNVQECGAFPPGTEVVIFGSSANGFGSPKSDLDLCLQLPGGMPLNGEDDTGAEAMAKLAAHFEKTGMVGVDTARLTARIPIIMYKCPDPFTGGNSGEDLHECDLSMHNPLAVLNTSLLRSYAEITPVTRVLAAIIKRWAKARDINSPARHTLSSYGYIIMLLHFLTYHKRTGNGLVSPVAESEGDPEIRKQTKPQTTPLLPNLQWVDPNWPHTTKGSPYRELSSVPKNIMKHPMKDTSVNTYFYKPTTPHEKQTLQILFPGQDLSLAILLASFFRYYAYDFDYKRHVVSLHSTATRGVVEREVKAELDGWRNYSAALVIEDPFELDYDVAHVLRGGYYHRIRREFALAYAKVADAASGRSNSWNKGDLRVMTGKDLVDWVCEPIASERDQLPDAV